MGSNSARAIEVIRKARTNMLFNYPFYGYVGRWLRLREDCTQPTMSTDGRHLFYNPDFTVKLSQNEIIGCLSHEVLHVLLKHFARGENAENFAAFARAGDLAINPRLKDGGVTLPEGVLYPEQEFWNDSTEQHYKREKAKKGKKGKGGEFGNGCSGVRQMKDLSPAERQAVETEIQTTIFKAAAYAKAAGMLPGFIERMIETMRAPKVAWFDVMRRFMQTVTKNDYKMMPPNRRYIHQNLYLPSLHSETVGDVVLFLDGSGSTHHVFPQFMSEYASVLLDIRPERLHVVVWDTRCTWYEVFDSYNDESLQSIAEQQAKMGAGGGTSFEDCFNWFAAESGVTPQIAVILTDMELFTWPEDPGYPVLWVATTDAIGPFGETVKIEA